jgi:hypothetical protein
VSGKRCSIPRAISPTVRHGAEGQARPAGGRMHRPPPEGLPRAGRS